MSLKFSDTSSPYDGILQQIELELGFEQGDITGNDKKLGQFTSLVNLAWDDYIRIAMNASGGWQFDDSNQTDFPIIKTNLVSAQQDYTFTTDGSGNLILDIYKVLVLTSTTGTEYQELTPIDAQSDQYNDIAQETSSSGVPMYYDKTANGLLLTPTPNYNATNGLKVFINREPLFFTTSDTTKKPGCPGNHHEYFVLRPAYTYARRNDMARSEKLLRDLTILEGKIEKDFTNRQRDVVPVMTPEPIIYE